MYQPGSPKIKDGVKAKAQVTISHLRLNYIQEVVLRLIDYLNSQLLPIVYYP
jgi:hypothetical protein